MQNYTTDELVSAAILAAFGARVMEVTYVPSKGRSDITLDVEGMSPASAAAMLRTLAERLDGLGQQATAQEIEIAVTGSIVHHALNWLSDLKRKVVARRQAQ